MSASAECLVEGFWSAFDRARVGGVVQAGLGGLHCFDGEGAGHAGDATHDFRLIDQLRRLGSSGNGVVHFILFRAPCGAVCSHGSSELRRIVRSVSNGTVQCRKPSLGSGSIQRRRSASVMERLPSAFCLARSLP